MKFIDLSTQQRRIHEVIESRISKVLAHGKYILGPEVIELENRLREYTGTRYAIACASGTDALLMALMAHNIGPGDCVITTPFTFISTAEVISLLGAVPIFVDIDPVSFNLDPALVENAAEAITEQHSKTYPLPQQVINQRHSLKGIIAVDLFGLPADYKAINSVAEKYGLFVIEDAAQSYGGEYDGRKCGSLASVGCTSFFPAKPLGCYGDGGMCFTNGNDMAETLNSIRVHGKGMDKYDNVRIGINGRLDTLQAAILLAKLEIFMEEVELRQAVAHRYQALLSNCQKIQPPKVPDGMKSAWAQYSVMAEDEIHRQVLQAELKKHDIPTAVYYPKPLHLQPAFGYLGYGVGDFPASEDCSKRIFSLPMHPYLTEKDQEQIADIIHTIEN